MAEQLASSGFALYAYAAAKYGLKKDIDPKKSLPHWITSRADVFIKVDPLSEEEIKKVKRFYKDYSAKHAKPAISEGYTYHRYEAGTPLATRGFANNFKCYIEDESLRNLQELEQTLNDLRAENLHPHDTKLFEGDRLVLYWHSQLTDDTTERISSVFSKHGVRVRGPAQDPEQIAVKADERYETQVRMSNDASLGEAGKNPFKWERYDYDKGEFFRQYLRLVFYGAKDPSEPYRIGFVPIIVENPEKYKEIIERLGGQIQIEGLSTYTTDSYHMDAFS